MAKPTGTLVPPLMHGFSIPNAPCMDYLPTLGEKWPHSRGNVGKYSIRGASGNMFNETVCSYFSETIV